jgi:hypothetical protein
MALFAPGPLAAADLNAINGYVEKTADQSVTSSITLVNDTHLSYAISGAGTFIFELFLFAVASADPGGGVRYGFTFPAGTMHYGINVPISSLASGTSGSGDWAATLSATSGVAAGVGGTSTSTTLHRVAGRFAATASGTLQFQWAQASSSANTTTLKAGSFMRVQRVA